MIFNPKTEKEIQELNLLKEGIYNFEVIKAEHSPSQKTGKDQIKLTLKVFGPDKVYIISDWLNESMLYKLKHFCDTQGLSENYNMGSLEPHDCENKQGKVKIIIQQERTVGDRTYPTQNSVRDYIKDDAKSDKVAPSLKKELNDFVDDDLPF